MCSAVCRVSFVGWWVVGALPVSVASGVDPDDGDGLRDLLDHLDEGPGLFVSTARKAVPYEIFVQIAVPTGRARQMAGDFLWMPGHAAEVLSGLTVLLDDPDRRAEMARQSLARVDEHGDAPDFDAVELFAGPLRVLRHAVDHRMAVLGIAAIN